MLRNHSTEGLCSTSALIEWPHRCCTPAWRVSMHTCPARCSPILGQHGCGLKAAQAARQLIARQHLQRHGLEAVLGEAGRLRSQPLLLVELRRMEKVRESR